MIKGTAVIFTLVFFYLQAAAQMVKTVDSLLSGTFKANEPGVAVLIAEKGEVLYEKAYGSANLELNTAMQPAMVFRIGSVTKQFTAIGIMQLAEQGKIALSDSIQKYVPDFPSKGYTITIENLLTHTSGIPDYANADTINPFSEREDFTTRKIIHYFKQLPLEFAPGTSFRYSNSGYVLLAYIIEKVTGEDYHKWMEENIIKPAGLKSTMYANENTVVPGRVKGYTRDRGFYENCEYQTLSMGFGCGDLLSTVKDLYQWNRSLLAYKLVRKETLEKAFTPFRLNNGSHTSYGYGWFTDSLYGSKSIHHEGQTSGFIAEEAYFPAQDVFVAILTNLKSGEDKTDFSGARFRLFNTIISVASGQPLQKEIVVSNRLLDSYTGVYAASFKKNSTLTVYKKDGNLFLDLTNGTGKNMLMLPQSDTIFLLPDVKWITTTCEFIKENGIVSKLIFAQDKAYEWKKIK